jgi:hypothetical protein
MMLSPLKAAVMAHLLDSQNRDTFRSAYRYGLKVYVRRANALSAKAIVKRAMCDKNITLPPKSTIP